MLSGHAYNLRSVRQHVKWKHILFVCQKITVFQLEVQQYANVIINPLMHKVAKMVT